MPRMKTENITSGDMSWISGSAGLREARTETVDISAWDATHYPNGFIPSGTPAAKVGGKLVPYDADEDVITDAGVLAGHILTDQPVIGAGDFAVPLYDHGRVKVSKLPVSFTPPAAAAKRAAITIVYI